MNNTSRYKIYGILAAALVVAAGVVWFYPGRNAPRKSDITRTPKSVVAKQAPLESVTDVAPVSNTVMKPLVPVSTQIGPLEPFFYTEVSMINAIFKLDISPDQLADFAKNYSALVSRRLEIEASIAQITKIEENLYEVEIPSYKEEGIKLRDELCKHVERLLISLGKEQYVEQVASALDTMNYNWGINSQNMLIKCNSKIDCYEIDHYADSYVAIDNGYIYGKVTRKTTASATSTANYYYIIKMLQGIMK